MFAALDALPQLRVDVGWDDSPCADGPCAWCGVIEARGWGSYGHSWADGTSAPLCGSCGVIFERYGCPDPHWWDGQRAAIAEAATPRRP